MKSLFLRAVASISVACMLMMFTAPSHAQTLTVLWPFDASPSPENPYAGLLVAGGNLYGTSHSGGVNSAGTVFEVSSTGEDTVLYNFTGGTSDGAYPQGGVIADPEGNLYGTTLRAGANDYGAVFEVSSTGQETILYSFAGGTTDGCYPSGGLLRDAAGNLYGTTYQCGAYGYGTVFELSNSGQETVVHSFAYSDGANPYLTSLVMDEKGNLYGITSKGGGGFGTVYRLSNSGSFTVLYSFVGGTTDGCFPSGIPLLGQQALYGTTESCGSSGDGVVWKVSQLGKDTILHNFAGGTSDGATPYAGVIMDSAGNLYGTTSAGGASGLGTVYQLSASGTLTLLHSFAGSDGETPYGGLIKGTKGYLYGTAETGGSGGSGTVWQWEP